MNARTLIILGAGGDLTARLLLPGLVGLLDPAVDEPEDLAVIGSGREDHEAEFLAALDAALAGAGTPKDTGAALRARTRWQCADSTSPEDLRGLLDLAAEIGHGPPAIYFALPPAVAVAACHALQRVQLPEGTRLVLEKPFGTDTDSARELNASVARLVPEDHVHRVDHFLGTDAVLGLLGLRFGNRIFEPVWNADHIASVDIVWDETLGLEGRAGYYDDAGALIDMVQSHLLQVLALLTMEPPEELTEKPLRDAVQQVLAAVVTPTEDQMTERTSRSRWTAGTLGGQQVPGYAESEGVDPDRGTETLAEVELRVDLPRWRDVPFRLRSGKGVGTERKEVVVTFKQVSWLPRGFAGEQHPTRWRFALDPADITLELAVNGPGDPRRLGDLGLTTDVPPGRLPAYGEVLAGVFDGDPLLSVRSDSAVECWRIVDPIVAAWRAGRVPLREYSAGSVPASGLTPVHPGGPLER